jgi:hypothetical protein
VPFERREIVVLTGETVGHGEQKLLPIIRKRRRPRLR